MVYVNAERFACSTLIVDGDDDVTLPRDITPERDVRTASSGVTPTSRSEVTLLSRLTKPSPKSIRERWLVRRTKNGAQRLSILQGVMDTCWLRTVQYKVLHFFFQWTAGITLMCNYFFCIASTPLHECK